MTARAQERESFVKKCDMNVKREKKNVCTTHIRKAGKAPGERGGPRLRHSDKSASASNKQNKKKTPDGHHRLGDEKERETVRAAPARHSPPLSLSTQKLGATSRPSVA